MKKTKDHITQSIIINRRLFASEAEADAVSSKIRRRPTSYITINVGGVRATKKLREATRKSKGLRRKVRKIVKSKLDNSRGTGTA